LFFALTTLVQRWLQPRGARVEESLPTAEAPDARDAHAELAPLAGDRNADPEPVEHFVDDLSPPPIRPAVMTRPLELWRDRGASAPMLEGIDAAFASEPVDSLWSLRMEGQILSEVAQMTDDNLVNVQVECRTSMCRVQLTQGMSLQLDEVAPTAMQMLAKLFARLDYGPPTPPVAMVRDGPSALTTVAYLRRAGAR
jgi:hypothetical protein